MPSAPAIVSANGRAAGERRYGGPWTCSGRRRGKTNGKLYPNVFGRTGTGSIQHVLVPQVYDDVMALSDPSATIQLLDPTVQTRCHCGTKARWIASLRLEGAQIRPARTLPNGLQEQVARPIRGGSPSRDCWRQQRGRWVLHLFWVLRKNLTRGAF